MREKGELCISVCVCIWKRKLKKHSECVPVEKAGGRKTFKSEADENNELPAE